MVPSCSVELSMPNDRSMVFRALPAMLFISDCRNELRAEFIENFEVLPSERYMPVVSIVTASLPRSSGDFMLNSSDMVWFSGASIMNSSPMSFSVFDSFMPVRNVTMWLTPSMFTLAFTVSLAVMCSRGFIISPVHSR